MTQQAAKVEAVEPPPFVIRKVEREPVGLEGFEDCYVTPLRLTERMAWSEACAERRDPDLPAGKIDPMVFPITLHYGIRKANGEPADTVEGWDTWGGMNYEASQWLFQRCTDMFGDLSSAKKK